MLVCDVWHDSLIIDHTRYLQDWRVLDHDEKIQAEKFSTDQLKQRYAAAHGRLRHILAQYVNASPASLRIQKTAQGKPYLVDYPELAFNLSHTGDYSLIAVAHHCQLGVDIEQCKPRTSFTTLVKKCFSVEEATHWQQLPEAEQLREFYQFWTRKEAFVKATGFGISLGLSDCVLNPSQPQTFLAVPSVCGVAADWHNRDIFLGKGLCAALVANKPIASINLNSK